MNYTPNDFNGMPFDPFPIKRGMMWEVYPKLKRRKELYVVPVRRFEDEPFVPKTEDLNLLIKFLVLLVVKDKNPIAAETNFEERRRLAFATIGIPPQALLREMIEESHWWVADVMSAFFSVYADAYYETWFSMRANLAQMNAFMRQKIDFSGGEDVEKNMAARQRVATEADSILKKLVEMESKLFGSAELATIVAESAASDEEWADKYALDWATENPMTGKIKSFVK